jgi:hypothetical protein
MLQQSILEQFFSYAYQWLELKLYDCPDIYMLGTTEEVRNGPATKILFNKCIHMYLPKTEKCRFSFCYHWIAIFLNLRSLNFKIIGEISKSTGKGKRIGLLCPKRQAYFKSLIRCNSHAEF